MDISEASTAGKKAVERDKEKTDIAAVAESLAAGGMGIAADAEGRCGSSERVICAM
jgi:hypothetical protein